MMRKKIIFVLISGLVVLAFISLAISGIEKKKKDDLYQQVELFSDSLAIIQAEYVDEASPKDLIYGALKGMLSSLDPHSQFMDPDTYNELKVDTEGKFGGIGIEITIKDGLLTVVTPIEDTLGNNDKSVCGKKSAAIYSSIYPGSTDNSKQVVFLAISLAIFVAS